jgi:hypothetical protein
MYVTKLPHLGSRGSRGSSSAFLLLLLFLLLLHKKCNDTQRVIAERVQYSLLWNDLRAVIVKHVQLKPALLLLMSANAFVVGTVMRAYSHTHHLAGALPTVVKEWHI